MKQLAIRFAIVCFLLALPPLWAADTQSGARPGTLELKIKVESNGKLAYRLINKSRVGMAFGMMSCSKMDHWSMNSAAVKLLWPDFKGCDKNVCDTVILNGKQSLAGTLEYSVQNGVRPPSAIRLHFKSCTGIYTGKSLPIQDVWSNGLKLNDFGG